MSAASKPQSDYSAYLSPRRIRLPWGVRLFLQGVLVIGVLALLPLAEAFLRARGIALQAAFSDYLVVMLLGALVGFVEIVSRYQDAPFRTALTRPGIFYMGANALVAATALWLMRMFGWTILPDDTSAPAAARWAQVITAGLGAMALFRSSLFVFGKEDQEVSIGPSAVLQVLLSALDKEVDRHRGQERAQKVRVIMEKVKYENAVKDLVVISKALMQNLNQEDSAMLDELRKQMEIITDVDPDVRKFLLGLRIMDVVGEDVLQQALEIAQLAWSIEEPPEEDAEKKEPPFEGMSAISKDLKEKFASSLLDTAPTDEINAPPPSQAAG